MSLVETKTCPRKSFLRQNIPSGVIKASVLRGIMKEAVLKLPLGAKKPDVDKMVDAVFSTAATHTMFGFELESETDRMKDIINRYEDFERRQTRSTVLSQEFSNKVKFAGKEHSVSAHRLVDRGTAIECIRYIYKAPEMTYRSKSPEKNPATNPDLLLLQKCGEAEAKRLGVDKPVFGSFYYMKSRDDRSKQLDPQFEKSTGANIVNYSFTEPQAKALEVSYVGVVETPSSCGNETECRDCRFNDLCNTDFDKRTLVELPAVEETPLDKIRMTGPQQRFVEFNEGQCRVNAVAGSGKTTIVTLRTLRLIEEGCKPEQILMVTFTEKAKMEMRSRLRRYAKGATLKDLEIDTNKIVVETFNSFGQGLLDKHFDKLGFTRCPALVDEVVKRDVVAALLEDHRTLPLDYKNPFLDMPNATGAVVQMCRLIDAMKASHVKTPDDVEKLVGGDLQPRAAELLEIYQAYNAKLVELNMIDYEDQLRLILELKAYGVFQDLPFVHIVVDEFQDSDPNQIGLILEMAKACKSLKSLAVVGDEMQAIYGFRNASPENLVNFGNYFPAMIDFPMEDNFRSHSPIIAMANRILTREARIAKTIRANRKEKGLEPVLMPMDKMEDEQELYVKQVRKLLRDGTPAKDIAILCRTKSELLGLQKKLDEAKVPTILRVPEVVATSPYVKACVALAAFLLNHDNVVDLALYRKSLGMDPFDAAALNKEAEELGAKYDALTEEEDRIALFFGLLEDAREDYVADHFLKQVSEKGFHTAREIFRFCVKYRDYGVKETLSTAREDADAVTLITVHSAKGLEWPVVLLSLRKFKAVDEEEHRLLYVAVTRAKEKLLVTYPKKQTILVGLLA